MRIVDTNRSIGMVIAIIRVSASNTLFVETLEKFSAKARCTVSIVLASGSILCLWSAGIASGRDEEARLSFSTVTIHRALRAKAFHGTILVFADTTDAVIRLSADISDNSNNIAETGFAHARVINTSRSGAVVGRSGFVPAVVTALAVGALHKGHVHVGRVIGRNRNAEVRHAVFRHGATLTPFSLGSAVRGNIRVIGAALVWSTTTIGTLPWCAFSTHDRCRIVHGLVTGLVHGLVPWFHRRIVWEWRRGEPTVIRNAGVRMHKWALLPGFSPGLASRGVIVGRHYSVNVLPVTVLSFGAFRAHTAVSADHH